MDPHVRATVFTYASVVVVFFLFGSFLEGLGLELDHDNVEEVVVFFLFGSTMLRSKRRSIWSR